MFEKDQIVTVEGDDGQHLRYSVGRKARVIKHISPFVIIDVDFYGVRASLEDYIQPVVTEEALKERLLV